MYKALQPGRWIRLLHVQPAAQLTTPINCYFQEAHLDERPKFEALSYVWGAKVGDQPIQCHGKTILVTSNCFSALQHLRYETRTRVLWVDAICINQASMAERSSQVKLMGDIYKDASNVLIWLGVGNAATHALLNDLKQSSGYHAIEDSDVTNFRATSGSVQEETEVMYEDALAILERANEEQKQPNLRSYPVSIVGSRPRYRISVPSRDAAAEGDPAWQYILDNDWFRRVWTAQEFILASKRTLVCGTQSIEWELIDDALWKNMSESNHAASIHLLMSLKIHYDKISDGIRPQRLQQTRNTSSTNTTVHNDSENAINRSSHWSQTLAMLPGNMYCRLTSDPRDRAYGFYCIARDLGMLLPEPDYNKTLNEVYEELTFSLIETYRSLSILAGFPGSIDRQGSPSWVPDWDGAVDGNGDFHMDLSKFDLNEQGRFTSTFVLNRIPGQLTLLGTIHEDCTVFGTEVPPAEDQTSWDDHTEELQRKMVVALWMHEHLMACKRFFPGHPSGIPFLNHFLWAFIRPKRTDDLGGLYDWFNDMNSFVVGVNQCAHDAQKRIAWANALDRPELLGMSADEVFDYFLRDPPVQQYLDLIWDKAQFFKRGRPIVTSLGLIGVSQVNFHEGYYVALVHGCMEPMILRRVGAAFRLVGFASMRGVDDNQWPIRSDEEGLQEINII